MHICAQFQMIFGNIAQNYLPRKEKTKKKICAIFKHFSTFGVEIICWLRVVLTRYFAIYFNSDGTNERHPRSYLLPIYTNDRFKLMEIINKQNDWPAKAAAAAQSMMLKQQISCKRTHVDAAWAKRNGVGVCGIAAWICFFFCLWFITHRRTAYVVLPYINSNSTSNNGIICVLLIIYKPGAS